MSVLTESKKPSDHELFPSDDGQPMAETPFHANTIILLKEALDDCFELRPDVYIAADTFWYWDEGNPKACAVPDLMVVPGVGRKDRYSFLSWRENGAVPTVIFEIATRGTWRENLNEKQRIYEKLGVAEYFVFDPDTIFLDPPLRGFRLQNGSYEDLPLSDDGMTSEELGLRMTPEFGRLELTDVRSGKRILTRLERIAAAEEAIRRAKDQIARAGELAALATEEAELAKKEATMAKEEVQQAAAMLEHERQLVEQVKKEAADKDAEIANLKAQLEAALKKSDSQG
jgi:Uma2 family endonuclease